VPKREGKRFGKHEGSAGKLTVGFNRAEKGRRTRIDGGAELRRPTMVAAAAQGPIRPGIGSNGHGMGRRRWRARLGGLGHEEIGVVGATHGDEL
jgi:hypothetical protein